MMMREKYKEKKKCSASNSKFLQIKKFHLKSSLKNHKIFHLIERVFVANLSPSALPSPSLDAEEPRESPPRISPGKTSSLRCIVKEFLPFLPKPIRRFRPSFVTHKHFNFQRLEKIIQLAHFELFFLQPTITQTNFIYVSNHKFFLS